MDLVFLLPVFGLQFLYHCQQVLILLFQIPIPCLQNLFDISKPCFDLPLYQLLAILFLSEERVWLSIILVILYLFVL